MGRLVLADGHERGLVDDDVGGLQDRVREQPVVDVVGLVLALLLVRRGALQPAHRGDRHEQPGELRVLGPVALDEQRAALRVEPEGEQRGGHLAGLATQQVGVVQARQGVVVDDAVDRLVLPLELDVVADRAQVVADVRGARRLDAGEDARARGRGHHGRRGGRGSQSSSSASVAAADRPLRGVASRPMPDGHPARPAECGRAAPTPRRSGARSRPSTSRGSASRTASSAPTRRRSAGSRAAGPTWAGWRSTTRSPWAADRGRRSSPPTNAAAAGS